MTRRILKTLALLALAAAVSTGLLHAQGSPEAERPPYRIDLHPGWNLISLPGDPVDPTLENVIGDSQVDIVLAYQAHRWGAAVRNTEGMWRTTSSFTTMSGGRGYWLHALTEDVIEAELFPDAAEPSPEGCGWQLMGIWEADQRPPGTAIDADDYFRLTAWRVAYAYHADADLWAKVIPRSDGTLETGAGYWVWNSCPASCGLCP